MQVTLVETIKPWLQLFGVGSTLFGLAWGVKTALDTLKRIESNHLAHAQASLEQLVMGVGEMVSAVRLHDHNEATHHEAQMAFLAALLKK